MTGDASLNGPGPKNAEFRASLGGLDFDKLSPETKLSLWRKWQAGHSMTTRADVLAREFEAKLGKDWLAQLNTAERAAYVAAGGALPKATISPETRLGLVLESSESTRRAAKLRTAPLTESSAVELAATQTRLETIRRALIGQPV